MRGAACISSKGTPRRGIRLLCGLLATFLLACAAPGTATGSLEREPYRCLDQSFTVSIPRGWTRVENGHPYGDLTTISGVRLMGPVALENGPVTISVLHYSGEHLFRTPEEFIQNELNSIVRIDHEREATLTERRTARWSGRMFYTKTFELVYLPQLDPQPLPEGVVVELAPPNKQIDMMNQYIVIAAHKGFFVLKLSTPDGLTKEYQSLFDDITESFRPLLR